MPDQSEASPAKEHNDVTLDAGDANDLASPPEPDEEPAGPAADLDIEDLSNIIADEEALAPSPAMLLEDEATGITEDVVEPVKLDEAYPADLSSEAETTDEAAGTADGLGRFFGRRRYKAAVPNEDDMPRLPGPAQPAAASTNLQAIRRFFDPGFRGIDLRWPRRVIGIAVLLVLALLLANQAGAALIVASVVIPVLVVMLLSAQDVYERESSVLLVGVGVVGGLAGVLLGGLGSWVVGNQWFNEGHLNFGAGGFGGEFASGAAPFLVWLVVGLLLPAAIVAGLAAAPLLMRRWPQFANEVMDGMILAGASAAGLAIGLSTTFWWPMTYGDGPLMDVSEWTLTIAGQVLLRPLVISLSGAMIGAGVWRYMLHLGGSVTLVLPAVGGVLGIMGLSLGSLAMQPSGIWPEFLFTLALAVLIFAAYRRTLESAIATDSAVMGQQGERRICPHCHQVTPVGEFCGRCGKPLDVTMAPDL